MNGSTFDQRLERNWKWSKAYFDRKTKEFGIKGWKLVLNASEESKNFLGQCVHGRNNEIHLSYYFLRGPTTNEKKLRNTILHELAHVMAGPFHDHDDKWKYIAKKIGCDATVASPWDGVNPKYIVYCRKRCSKFSLDSYFDVRNKVCIHCREPLKIKRLL